MKNLIESVDQVDESSILGIRVPKNEVNKYGVISAEENKILLE